MRKLSWTMGILSSLSPEKWRPFNLLQPSFKTEIMIAVTQSDDLKVHAPDFRTKEEAKKLCNYLLQAAHIIALKAGLQLIMDREGGTQ